MKLLFISEENLSAKLGVRKKVFGQTKAFSALGSKTVLLFVSDKKLWQWEIGKEKKEIGCIKGNLDILFSFYRKCSKLIKEIKPEAVYIRAPFTEFFYVMFLRKLKQMRIRVIVEYPTFPYDHEYLTKSFFKKNALAIDKFFRKFLHEYVDLVVSPYTVPDKLFGIPAFKFSNGISTEEIPVNPFIPSDKLTLIGVANITPSHGYDRIIEGMKNHYAQNHFEGKQVIYFHIVGDGAELKNLKKQVSRCNLDKYVIFHGVKSGKDLDEVFLKTQVGIDVLGMHRKGVTEVDSLKAREYCARGIPFVSSCMDFDFPDSFPYRLKLPANDAPVEMETILSFYERCKRENFPAVMRAYAQNNLTWEIKMKPVFKLISDLVS